MVFARSVDDRPGWRWQIWERREERGGESAHSSMATEERQTPTSLFAPPLIVYIDHRPTYRQTYRHTQEKKRKVKRTDLPPRKSEFPFVFFLIPLGLGVVKGAGAARRIKHFLRGRLPSCLFAWLAQLRCLCSGGILPSGLLAQAGSGSGGRATNERTKRASERRN